ncbi:hypothetical protein [Methylobacterium sp. J-068]|uniref:hypothetical protein n=1 Tax=Methylobacterium sp. J-068 TaxID=2836649 RepID=UPI001FBA0B24|nr:hypothetical protein [Methylobacterium sp. J-068]MCJ2034514.1 hypothetical protein [Methylobacterium sp. J-068]
MEERDVVAAVSIGLSLIPMAAPTFFSATMPDWTGPIPHGGITLGSIRAIVLHPLLNSDRLGQTAGEPAPVPAAALRHAGIHSIRPRGLRRRT